MRIDNQIDISVIIVNYNVKEYLVQALSSIDRALTGITNEVYVVDNNSVDGSVTYLKTHFPQVKLVENNINLGFGRANNQALKMVKGKYIVLINPDTVVQEDTFKILLSFFASHDDAGAATCKIINPNGSFSVDCRHSIPTPRIALWKVMGLSKLFPKSRIFGQYNLTYMDSEKTDKVPAISGSFMMIKREVFQKTGYFDEQFFMYCEDIDLCFRIKEKGYEIYYVPDTQIIHYKSESTKKDNLDYVITFNRSLFKFFQKYYAPQSIFFFRWLVNTGIFLRGSLIYLKNFLKSHFAPILDTVLLNIIILLSFIIRLEIGRGFTWEDYTQQFWVINLIGTILFLSVSFYYEIYPKHRFSIQSIVKANIITFILLAFLTFFFKQFAFSRMVVLFTFILSPICMILWRSLLRMYHFGDRSALGKDLFSKRSVVVGRGVNAFDLFGKMKLFGGIENEMVGWITIDEKTNKIDLEEKTYLGTLKDLSEIVRIYKIRQVIFSAQSLSYEEILKTMSEFKNPLIVFKMVPSNLDVIIGKSDIERLDDFPLLDIDYSIGNRFNKVIKRFIDIAISLFIIIITLPIGLPSMLIHRVKNGKNPKFQNEDSYSKFMDRSQSRFLLFFYLMVYVFNGKLSLVGAPLRSDNNNVNGKRWYKKGLTGLVQINQENMHSKDDEVKFHLYYLKNQSTLLDMEILLKAIWKNLRKK
jgi:GT2 family glycosyltransferase/lipopolysaccharide/colanic/teichoic acid biosynthesis glycosyltransferase